MASSRNKNWELNLELKGSEYISEIPLIFQFPSMFNTTVKSLIDLQQRLVNRLTAAACKESISTAIFFFYISCNCKTYNSSPIISLTTGSGARQLSE